MMLPLLRKHQIILDNQIPATVGIYILAKKNSIFKGAVFFCAYNNLGVVLTSFYWELF